jgi:class 3 adenylate cyclase
VIKVQTALQRANEGEPEGGGCGFVRRHVDDVIFKDDEIFGAGLKVAAQLEGLVKGSEICFREACAITYVIAAA